jgi:hypothetical protein
MFNFPKNSKYLSFYFYITVIIFAAACASEPNASPNPAPAASIPRGPLYTGNGGKNTKIAVLQPQGENLSPEEQWISPYIQGVLTSDFNKYTAMTVIDRQNLDKLIENQDFSASGYFSDDDYLSIGNMLNAEYVLIGSLRKIPQDGSFVLDLSVSHAGTGQRMASFMPSSCNFKDIQNTSVIQRAFEDLAGQLGIMLTEYGKQSLHSMDNTEIASGTSLSKGIVAQQNKRIGEALSYYYESTSFNPSLTEASKRLNVLSSSISKGNITDEVLNDFQQREAWSNILKECEEFYSNHLPYEIIYNPALKHKSSNYENRTVDLEFTLATQPTTAFKVIQDILDGLKKSGKKVAWGFPCWPLSSPTFADYYIDSSNRVKPYIFDYNQFLKYPEEYMFEYYKLLKITTVKAELVNHDGKVIATASENIANYSRFAGEKSWSGYAYDLYHITTLPTVTKISFNDVAIDDMSDEVYVRISNINDIDSETAVSSGYIKISQGNI